MPFIVTTVHDPVALAATCRQSHVPAPREGCIQLDDQEVAGWIIRLPGVRFPIVCNTLTGLIAYHPSDNAFGRYACIMRYIFRYYAVQAGLCPSSSQVRTYSACARRSRHPCLAVAGR